MAATEKHSEGKWEGKTSSEIPNAEADQIWPLLEDFCNLHKWFPIDTCHHVEGVAGQPGLIRYCQSEMTIPLGEGGKMVGWAKEKLVALDPVQRYVTYEVVESNMGLKSYLATMKVVPLAGGCKIEWRFECDPMERWTYEDLLSFFQSCLQSMTKKMEQAFSAAT